MRRGHLLVVASVVACIAAFVAWAVTSQLKVLDQYNAQLNRCDVQLCNPHVQRLLSTHCSVATSLHTNFFHSAGSRIAGNFTAVCSNNCSVANSSSTADQVSGCGDTEHFVDNRPSVACYLLSALGLRRRAAHPSIQQQQQLVGDQQNSVVTLSAQHIQASQQQQPRATQQQEKESGVGSSRHWHHHQRCPHDPVLELSRRLWESEMAAAHEMTEDDLELARMFCPVVYFDSREKIRPMEMERYIEQCELKDEATVQVLQADLHHGIHPEHLTRGGVYLHHTSDWRRMDGSDIEDVPFYVKVDHGVHLQGQNVTSILYMFFYPYDYGGLGIAGKRIGCHVADLEHIRVLVKGSPPRIHRVHYAAHTFYEGRWHGPDSMQYFDPDTRRRVKAFPARNGHGSYAHPGRYIRLFGVAPDVMDGKGPVWNKVGLVRPYPHQMVAFRGKISKSILNGPCQEWWDQWEPENTPVCRFTGGFVRYFSTPNGRMEKFAIQASTAEGTCTAAGTPAPATAAGNTAAGNTAAALEGRAALSSDDSGIDVGERAQHDAELHTKAAAASLAEVS